ncbi:MAG: site-specific integrase [Candidatus Omnitrophica bacterium]|nr:site-specific integrase [Candidatus Omnitrophota bacterium]
MENKYKWIRITDNFFRRGKSYYYYAQTNGRRISKALGTNQKVAFAAYNKICGEIAENRFLKVKKVQKISFEVLADLYLELYAKKKKKSWEACDEVYIKKLKTFFGKMNIETISRRHVAEYAEKRRGEVGPCSVNRERSCLRKIFNWALYDWQDENGNPNYEGKNPASRFERLEEPEREKFLTKGQLINLLGKCSDKLSKFILLAVNTGMRKGEIRSIKRENINLDKSFVYLEGEQTKNGKSRKAPLNEIAIAIMKEVKDGCLNLDYNPRKVFEAALAESGVLAAQDGDFHWHDLRHSFASFLGNSCSVPIETISKLLGHSTMDRRLKITERYTHIELDTLLEAVRRLDVFFADIVGGLRPNSATKVRQMANKRKSAKTDYFISCSN